MIKITQEELLKIAQLSNLHVSPDEIPSLIKQVEDILSYAIRVKEVIGFENAQDLSSKNINVFREDVCIKTDDAPILAQAPATERNYFIVPVIIENN